ncbi:hypothetical protein HanPI659440_Chr04g0164131 [Helianthus annuus]|nr:hypothetical protein HanPI659440_Chr04g0164131 [Helianthus annuus]
MDAGEQQEVGGDAGVEDANDQEVSGEAGGNAEGEGVKRNKRERGDDDVGGTSGGKIVKPQPMAETSGRGTRRARLLKKIHNNY